MNDGDAFLYAFFSNELTEFDLLGYRGRVQQAFL